MTPELIIAMAHEAGVYSGANERVFAPSLERFAALVAAHQRELDAKACEARIRPDSEHEAPYNAEDMACAAAIRGTK